MKKKFEVLLSFWIDHGKENTRMWDFLEKAVENQVIGRSPGIRSGNIPTLKKEKEVYLYSTLVEYFKTDFRTSTFA